MFRFIESVVAFAASLPVCHTPVPHPSLFRAMDHETVYLSCGVASVTEPKFYAFYSIDGAYFVLAPNGNNLPEITLANNFWKGIWYLYGPHVSMF